MRTAFSESGKRGIDKNAAVYYSSERSISKGKEREEYTETAVRERKQKLRVSFGEGLWNVALEPERRKLLRMFC